MAEEDGWSAPIKAASIESTVADVPGLYMLFAKTPRVFLASGRVGPGEPGGLIGRLREIIAQEGDASETSRHLAADLEVGTVFGVDVKDPSARRRFIERECYFLVRAMPGSADADVSAAAAAAGPDTPPRYSGKLGFYPTIQW